MHIFGVLDTFWLLMYEYIAFADAPATFWKVDESVCLLYLLRLDELLTLSTSTFRKMGVGKDRRACSIIMELTTG